MPFSYSILLLQHQRRKLLKKGAEADIFLTDWYGKRAIAKVRTVKAYRHKSLDLDIRRRRTIREAQMLSVVKPIGIMCPHVYFVNPISCEIVMEFLAAKNAKEIINSEISSQIGTYAGLLHSRNIIHGDLTTSNFLLDDKLYLLDFGLSFHSDRLEDKAVDIRLIKETYSSVHHPQFETLFSGFLQGYSTIQGKNMVKKLLTKVSSIERRARYALN
jgi:TP53 regulating kinase-like protein